MSKRITSIDEVERRVRHRQLQRRLTAAQDELVAALSEQKQLYFALEDLLGQAQRCT